MKKVLYSLLTLAAALTVTSCLKEVEGGAVYDDGTFVDATFSVVLGPQTKAYADGTTVNQLYAGLYEVDDVDNPTSFTYVAHTENPINISGKKAQVSFDGKLKRGKIYAVVFWAQKNGAPYVLDWGENVTTGPFITIGRTGYANDETRDAFTAMDSFGPVTEAIVRDETHAVQLMRPFAQVNILVPNANVDETENLVAGDRVSGMTIAGLPNVLNLATAEVSSNDGGQDYVFTNANITEAAFGNFASGYQYMAMNYVPYGADLNANYQVTFSVINKSQTADNKVVNVPLKPNVRTNIVGNIFAEEFNYSAWAVVMPEPGELTSISLAVGTQGESAQNPVVLASVGATASVHPIISRDVTNETPTITVAPASVATASWNNQTGNVDITAQATGTAVITVVFPAVTKTSYAEGSIKLYVSVSGTDPAQKTARNLAFSASSATVTIDADDNIFPTLSGAKIDDVTYSLENVDPADCVTINGSNGAVNLFAAGTATVKATAPETDEYAAGEATYSLTVNAASVPTPTQLEMSTVSCTNSGENENSLNFSWTAVDHATGYMVSTDGTNYGAAQDALTYDLTGLEPGTEYTIHVKAIGDGTNYTDSDPVDASGTTKASTYNFTTIAALKALTFSTATEYTGTLTGAVVSFVPDTKDAIIKDDTGSILLYKAGHGLLQGQTISGEVTVTTGQYNGGNQITALTATVSGNGASVAPAVVTLADIVANFSAYECAYVKVAGLNVTAVSGKNVTVSDGTNSFVVYHSPGNATCDVGDVITAVGTVTRNNTTDEIKVWSADGITVTSSTPKAITFSQPASGGSFTVSVDGNNITSGTTVASGKTVTLTANAASGFTFAGWIVSGATVADAAATTTTFEMGSSAVSISASFTSTGGSTTTYTKVTAAPNDWSGTYIIVYESSGTSGLVCVAGTDAYQNFNSAVIANGVISSNDLSDCEVEIAAYSEGYSIKALGGTNTNKYIEGKGSSSNGTNFVDSPSKVTTFALAGGAVTITNNTNLFVYNSTSGSNGERWRFYKAATAADNVYKKPALYKKD